MRELFQDRTLITFTPNPASRDGCEREGECSSRSVEEIAPSGVVRCPRENGDRLSLNQRGVRGGGQRADQRPDRPASLESCADNAHSAICMNRSSSLVTSPSFSNARSQ